MILHPVTVSAAANAEQQASSADLVERGDELYRLDGVTWMQTPVPNFSVHVTDAMAESDMNGSIAPSYAFGSPPPRGDGKTCDSEMCERSGIPTDQKRLLGRGTDRLRGHRVIGEEHPNADIHGAFPA